MTSVTQCERLNNVVERNDCLRQQTLQVLDNHPLILQGNVTESMVKRIGEQTLQNREDLKAYSTRVENWFNRQRLEMWGIKLAVLSITLGLGGLAAVVARQRRRIYSCETQIGQQGATINHLGLTNGLGQIVNHFGGKQVNTFVGEARNPDALLADYVTDPAQRDGLKAIVRNAYNYATGYLTGGNSGQILLRTLIREHPEARILQLPED